MDGRYDDDPPPAYNSLPPMTAETMQQPCQQQVKPVAAMAFTVDFSGGSDVGKSARGPEAGSESCKKLGLKDGIGRFAPAKKFATSVKPPTSSSRAASAQQPHKPQPRNFQQMGPPPLYTSTSPASAKKGTPAVDEENNNSSFGGPPGPQRGGGEGDEANSDAGTYTIEDEEEDTGKYIHS